MKASLEKICISATGSIRDALEALQEGSVGILFVTDENRKLQGVLTDGDLRRAILANAALADPVRPFINPSVVSVPSSASRAEVLDLMQARRVEQIPAVDSDGVVHGVHLLHELLGAVERPNWAVIMAGGKGTRLGELTRSVPKPMLKVAGRPILERLVLHFVGFGIRRIFLSVGYLSDVIEQHFGDGTQFGCRIEYLREVEPLGTGGALALLPEPPIAPFFVCNGDLVTDANLEQMLCFHMTGKYSMTLALSGYSHQIPYGCVDLDGGKVVSVFEKPTVERLINAGIYVADPSVLKLVPSHFFPITELVDKCLERGDHVGGWPMSDEWIDVGEKNELAKARGTISH